LECFDLFTGRDDLAVLALNERAEAVAEVLLQGLTCRWIASSSPGPCITA